MIAHTYVPGPPLSRFVHTFWSFEDYFPAHKRERLLPDGSMAMIFALKSGPMSVHGGRGSRSESFRGGLAMGAHSEYFLLDTAAQNSVIGIHFKPGAAFPFLPCPAGELHNQHVGIEELYGARGTQLSEQLLQTDLPSARFLLLEQFLLERLRLGVEQPPGIAWAAQMLLRAPHLPVATIAGQIGVNGKRFPDLFRNQVGMTPKRFCRVQRFQNLLRSVNRRSFETLTEAALECGYFDQAHFNHDFQAFAGLNPSAYLAANPRYCNHLPLLD